MSTAEHRDLLRALVQHVSRAFYDSKFVVVLDQLAHHDVLKDDDLASRVGLPPKELQKLIAKLESDKLVKIYRRNEIQREGQRPSLKGYYYIDYPLLYNVVKWRITTMRAAIDDKLRNELDNQGYICPFCKKYFKPLDVLHLLDPSGQAFLCDACHHELVNNENAESVQGSKDRMQRFLAQTLAITRFLQAIDGIKMTQLDVQRWLADHVAARTAANGYDGDGLAIAGSGGPSRAQRVQIELSLDQDDAKVRQAREETADAMRQQNALPEWHARSTISGDLTSVGLASAAGGAIHNGGGALGAGAETDQKPTQTDLYANDLDRYYASLASQPSLADGDDDGDGDEEGFEEVTFDAVPPAPPAANGKRKFEENGTGDGRAAKAARMADEEEDEDDDFEEVA